MKMKTQIKRKAKRTISLLLTAMLVISTMIVGLATVNAAGSSGYDSACMHLIGEFTGKNWNTNQTAYKIDTAYNTGISDGLFYYEATVTPNTTYYFALYSNDNRYAPATQHTVIASSKDDAMSGDYGHTNNSWEYTSGANTTKIKICVDQYSPDSKWYPLVWIEDESVEPTTPTPSKTYYMWTSTNSNITDDKSWSATQMTYSDGTYVLDKTFPSNGSNYYFIINESSTSQKSSVWSSENEVKQNVTSTDASLTSNIFAQENNGYYMCGVAFPKSNTSVRFTFTPEMTVVLSRSTTEPTTEEPTTEEPTTVEPTTAEPTTVEPTTEAPTEEPTTAAPSTDTWYLKGDFNSWEETNQFTGSDDSLTTSVYISSDAVHTFKVWNKDTNKYYGTQTVSTKVNTAIKDYKLYYGTNTNLNVQFRPEVSGLYKFTFNPSTLVINAELVSSGLNAEVSAPESVKAGETFSITAKAILDDTSTITPASYKFTIMIDGKAVVSGATSNTNQYTYNRASISTPSAVSAYVEAYDADGNLLGVSPTVEKTVDVTYEDFSVKLSASSVEVAKESTVTFTAAATPASYVSSYDFYVSTTTDFEDATPVEQSLSTFKYTFNETGTYYVKVVAHNRYSTVVNSALDATSNVVEINVLDSIGPHSVTFYFKSTSAFAYKPKMVLDGNALTVERATNLGKSFSGSVTFYWFKATTTVDSTTEHTLVITTQRTTASGSITGHCYGSEYWFGIDNLMNGRELVNLTSSQEYIRNYYHSPLHTVYAGAADDSTLGFTNIDGTRYAMGTYAEGDPSKVDATLSVKAATAAQKAVSKLDIYSEVQTCLLDVNLDGKVDVRDATMIQRALVHIL